MIKKIKITKSKIEAFGTNPFEIQWTPDGSHLLVSGELSLGILTRDSWDLNYSKDFGHKKPISCIQWLSDTVLATAGLDKIIKIFDFQKRTLLHYIQSV
jgi:WD40 repeat protein